MAVKEKKDAKAVKEKSTTADLVKNLTTDEKKEKALEAAMEQIEKAFGKGAIMRLGQNAPVDIEAVSTGSLSLDIALGIGGLPMGRVIEIYGPESSGKTTLTLELIAQAQKKGKICAFIDAEHALDPVYAKRLGVKIEDMFISQPDTGEQALEICETLVRSGGVDVIIIDSVAALVPKAEIEGDMGDSHVGLQARLMSQALRKLTGIIKQANCMVVFINQLRMKIGVMFGSPETTTGGNALKYYASVRLDIRKGPAITEKIEDDVDKALKNPKDKKAEKVIGNETTVKVVKNKVAPPFKAAHFAILFNYGIAKTGELLDLGVAIKVVTQTGAWFSYNGQKIGQGKVKAMNYLDEHPELADEIEGKIREYFKKNSDYADSMDLGEISAGVDDEDPILASAPDSADDDLDTDALITPLPNDI